MASQGSEETADQTEEAEPTQDEEDLRISPAEEMPVDGPEDGDGEPEPEQLLLPWDRFSAWLHCVCVVGFDLELGQAVEVSCFVLQQKLLLIFLYNSVGIVCGLSS